MLRKNQQTGLSSEIEFLDIGGTVLEKGVKLVPLNIYLSKKAVMKVEFNLEIKLTM